jgi:hypothetical protein
MQVSIRILYPPPQGSTRCDAASWRCLSVIFSLTLHSFGDKIPRHSDPTSKSLLGIIAWPTNHRRCLGEHESILASITCRSLSVRGFPKRMRRPYCHVVANMNQSSRRSRVEVLAWGDFPNACADLIVTLSHFRHFLVQLAIGVTGDVSWFQQVDFASCILHVCEQIGY